MKMNNFASAVIILLSSALLIGCIGGGEIGVDKAVAINVNGGGSLLGSNCEITVRMEDGSSKIFTGTKCVEEGAHVCVSKSMTPAIIDGCEW